MRKGWKTSEFWITTLTGVGTVAGVLAGIVSAPVGAVVLGVSGSAYAVARGLAKLRGGDVAGAVADGMDAAAKAQDVAKALRPKK